MAQPLPSLIVVGGGIVGLTLAVAARARGHSVMVLTRDPPGDTASGVAAGMVAPALEALNEPEPAQAFVRLKAAQSAWFDLFETWPASIRKALKAAQQAGSRYVWPQSDNTSDHVTPRLDAMAVDYRSLVEEDLNAVAVDCNGVEVSGEMLLEARSLLAELTDEVQPRTADVVSVAATSVKLATGEVLTADAVVLAGGYASRSLAGDVPCLGHLTAIKGHILDTGGQGGFGVVRSPYGYLADYGAVAKFGATMEFGVDDPDIDDAAVAGLKLRAHEIMPGLDLTGATARTGIRAASPDGWPMIGRDTGSGVYVATAMRRNGYIFAPLAASLILDLLAGDAPAEAELYDPNRF